MTAWFLTSLPWWPCALKLAPPLFLNLKSLSFPRPLLRSFLKRCFSLRRSGRQTRGKAVSLETHPSLLHLPHLSTVGFSSAIMWPLMLLALLMPTAMLLKNSKSLSACCFCRCSVLLVFAPWSPESFVCFQSLAENHCPELIKLVKHCVAKWKQMYLFFLRQIDDIIIIFLASDAIVQSYL